MVEKGHSAEIQITGSRGSVFMVDDYFKVWEFDDETEADEIIRKDSMDQSSSGGAGAADPSAIDFSSILEIMKISSLPLSTKANLK